MIFLAALNSTIRLWPEPEVLQPSSLIELFLVLRATMQKFPASD